MSGFISGKNDSAVDELLSQVNDEYDLEQVAAINCAGFTDDSALPTNLETRLRRLKSLPVARTYPVSSSSKKLLSHSKSMASYNTGKKSLGNVSSASANFSIQTGKSCPLDSSVEETQIFSEIKRNPSVDSRGKLGDFSDSGRSSGSSSSRFSQEGNVFAPTTQTMKLLVPKEESRISSSSSTSINLASPSASDQDQKERMKS
ncbi:hypothetical protein V5N11_004075 [Cardamine amara subsp. amara]|uniref:Uncharacterized protein n=1 Tax=Cardamine amara subsp. amara TaxID=228776 RepID=A0ABD0ZHJ1_CARAN